MFFSYLNDEISNNLFLFLDFLLLNPRTQLASSQLCKDETLSTKKLVNSVKQNVAIIQTSHLMEQGAVLLLAIIIIGIYYY